MSLVIISGGPGAGKTTLLDALAGRGYRVYPEVPRLLIERESSKQNGILPWHDLPAFAELCYDACWCKNSLRKVRRWRFWIARSPIFVRTYWVQSWWCLKNIGQRARAIIHTC